MTSTQHVRVEGGSYQRGRQYGRQAATRVRLSVQAYQQTFAHYAGWDWPAVRREAARFEAPIGTVMPAYLEELRGIADGAAATRGMQRVRLRPRARPERPRAHRAELGLAPALGPDPGRAGGPPGRGPRLRHGGRGRPARQDRDERGRPRSGHQCPGDRRGRG